MVTRSHMQGKARALATATRVSESSLGMTLLRNHFSEDRTYLEKLRGLAKESRSVQNELEHQRMQFLKRRLGTPGPLIILEQTRSPAPLSKNGTGSERRGKRPKRRRRRPVEDRGGNGGHGSRPRYMMPTMSSGSEACSTSTLGAYRISTQRPLDEWNPTTIQKIYFRSAIMPSWPLTESDLGELRTALSRHCWIHKFRNPVHLTSAETSKGSIRSMKDRQSVGSIPTPSDDQGDSDTGEDCAEEKLPVIDGISGSMEVSSSRRSHSHRTSFDCAQSDHSPSASKVFEQRHQSLPMINGQKHSNSSDSKVVVRPIRRPLNKKDSTLSKVQPLLKNEESFFKTSIEYSISSSAADVRKPEKHHESSNTICPESRAEKPASANDSLTEMTSIRKPPKSSRAVTFADNVINIGCRTSM